MVEAAKVLIHAFPKYNSIVPAVYILPSVFHVLTSISYTQQCELLMPQLDYAFSDPTTIQ